MEDMKKQQLEVLEEAKDYCQKVLHCIDTVIPELKGDKKDDTDEYLRMTVDAVNNTLEMYNATRSLVQEYHCCVTMYVMMVYVCLLCLFIPFYVLGGAKSQKSFGHYIII